MGQGCWLASDPADCLDCEIVVTRQEEATCRGGGGENGEPFDREDVDNRFERHRDGDERTGLRRRPFTFASAVLKEVLSKEKART